MPQASEEQRAKWGTDGGAGDEKAIAYLEGKGFKLTRQFFWVKPWPYYILTNDDREAMSFLCDEWDFGWLAPNHPGNGQDGIPLPGAW